MGGGRRVSQEGENEAHCTRLVNTHLLTAIVRASYPAGNLSLFCFIRQSRRYAIRRVEQQAAESLAAARNRRVDHELLQKLLLSTEKRQRRQALRREANRVRYI